MKQKEERMIKEQQKKVCETCKWKAIVGRSEPCALCWDYERWEELNDENRNDG